MAQVNGTSGNDRLVGTTGADTINGLGGNDTIVGGSGGADVIDGGAGFDTIEFGGAATSAVVVDFRNGTIFGGGTGSISFTGIERVLGSNFNDSLTGNAAGQNLAGQAAADTIWGAGGVDTLWGGGGAGDTFIFRETGIANADLIGDFASGVDKIHLDAAVMTALGASGNFAAGDARFWAAAGATGGHDADDRVIYDTTTRKLYYDADGSGAGAAQLIATLQSGATLAATDIAVEGGSSGGGQVINGTAGNDSLEGTSGNDTINGLAGNDTISGMGGSDSLMGGTGDDFVSGSDGYPFEAPAGDVLIGGDGNDTLASMNSFVEGNDANIDTLDGGLGDDVFTIDNSADVLSDAGGVDTVVAKNMSWTLGAGFENLELQNGGSETGETGIGNGLNNHMSGEMAPHLEGRAGNDTLIGMTHDGFGNSPVLIGGDGNDVLRTFGGDAALMDGGAGNDTLEGHQDFAILDGGVGNDVLSGGDLADLFVFSVVPGAANADLITDFGFGNDTFFGSNDTIQLDGNAYANSGTSGRFAAGDARFAANSTGTAQDASDRVIYNTTTRQILYDADGIGGAAGQLIATLQSGATLDATDIEVVNGSGGSSGQVINGTSGNDTLIGGAGNDTINGFAGNDSLDGGEGADYLVGGEGNDTLFNPDFGHGDGSADTLDGGLGDDIYYVSDIWTDGDVILADPGGVDTVIARNTDWTLGAGLNNLDLDDSVGSAFNGTGNELNNVIRSASEGGTLSGMGGNDLLIARHVQNTVRLQGGDGNDTLDGGGNHTVMFGDAGNDSLTGSGVEDELDGGAGIDTMNGGLGDDLYTVTAGDVLSDSGGIDAVRTDVTWSLGADFEHLTMTGTASIQMQGNNSDNFVVGNSGNNYFNARAGSDTIQAGGGNDSIDMSSSGTGNHGNDVVDGGAGFDNIDYDGYATRGIIANWTTGTISGGDAVGSTVSFTSVEAIIGGAFADQMSGNASGQNLTGKGGNDTLWGAGGADTLWGGTGADSFVFREMGTANADRIGDFGTNVDKIALDDSAFTAIGAAGNFAAGDGRFWAAAGATSGHDSNDRVIYNTTTGSLYYDADGSGAGAAQLIATLTGNPAVAATDITVI